MPGTLESSNSLTFSQTYSATLSFRPQKWLFASSQNCWTCRRAWGVIRDCGRCCRECVSPLPYNIEKATALKQLRVVGLSLAHEYPRARVLALDISAEQYPPAWTRPANIEFGLWNFFNPLPPELVGRFDVVHIRAICAPLINGGRDAVIKKLIQMLSKFSSSSCCQVDSVPIC